MSIKKYYLEAFPGDDLGNEIDSNATFEGLFSELDNYRDVYEYIGVNDSLVRERAFGKLAEIINMPYDYIYTQWLNQTSK